MSKLNREKAARALIEAEAIGNDRKAAEKLGISDRTIRNYRKARDADPVLSALFREYAAEEAKGWHIARVRALRKASERASELLETEADLDKVTRFMEKAGGTDLAAEALGVSSNHTGVRPQAEELAGAEPADSTVDPEADEEDEGSPAGSRQGDGAPDTSLS